MVTFVLVMLFNANEFEQLFNARTLKKGLKLFEDDKVILIARFPNNTSHFLIDSQFDLHIRKSGHKVISSACSCEKEQFCVHLCAALFYIQKDELGITINKKSIRKAKLTAKSTTDENNYYTHRIGHDEFINFILNDTKSGNRFSEHLLNHFSYYPEKIIFRIYLSRLRLMLHPYLQFEALSQNQINEIHQKIISFCENIGTAAERTTERAKDDAIEESMSRFGANNLFCLNLAVLAELPLIFNVRTLGNESGILDLIEHSKGALDLFFDNGLSQTQRQAWFEATLIAGATKNAVGIYAFTFLVPRSLNFISHKKNFEELNNIINKRRHRLITSNQFDVINIARLQLAIKAAELFSTPFPFKNYYATPEFAVAEAELLFCNHHVDKAFAVLENFYETVKSELANFLSAYLDYLISKAREKNRPHLEIKYLKESMVTALYIAPKNIDRLFELVPEKDRSVEVDQLIQNIKVFSSDYAFDKISVLLLKDNRPDVLLPEIKRQKNKFTLLHQIALKQWPDFNNNFLAVYTTHLSQALTDAAYDQYHEQIFSKAKKYLDRLPEEKSHEIVLKILNQLGAYSRIYKFIKGHYPDLDIQKKERVNKLRGNG